MFRVQAPILVVPTAEAREALGVQLRPAALAAYREIALVAKGTGDRASPVQFQRDDARGVLACPAGRPG